MLLLSQFLYTNRQEHNRNIHLPNLKHRPILTDVVAHVDHKNGRMYLEILKSPQKISTEYMWGLRLRLRGVTCFLTRRYKNIFPSINISIFSYSARLGLLGVCPYMCVYTETS